MANLLENTKRYLANKNKLPSLVSMDYVEARRMRAAMPKSGFQLAPLAKIEERFISVRDGEQIAIRIYTPFGDGPFPVIVYFHGGGWVLNDLNTCHESCSHLAHGTNQIVVSVAYRLAPEHKFPVPVNDAWDSALWTQAHAEQFNGIGSQISVAGDSAGGNLAIAICQLAKEQGNLPITAQILLYPVTDLSYGSNSYTLFEKGFGLDKDVMQWFGNYYINAQIDAKNPLVAPLQLKDFSSLPPALIIVAENDVLRDEAVQYGEKLRAVGTKTEIVTMEGVVHSFFTNNDAFPKQIQEAIDRIQTFLVTIAD
ncbi:MAG: alpha/beta hydrolase [Solibacillus sp.]